MIRDRRDLVGEKGKLYRLVHQRGPPQIGLHGDVSSSQLFTLSVPLACKVCDWMGRARSEKWEEQGHQKSRDGEI